MMDRRRFLLTTLVGAVVPSAAAGQPGGKVVRLGLLSDEPRQSNLMHFRVPFQTALRTLGYVEGRNLAIDERSSEGDAGVLARLAGELARLKIDVLVAIGGPSARAAVHATKSIPIVFARVSDPVALGLVSSLARPGGNVTGVNVITTQLAAKRLELLKEAVPRLARVTLLWDPSFLPTAPDVAELEETARSLKLDVQRVGMHDPDELQSALASISADHVRALVFIPNPRLYTQPKRVTELLAGSRLPAMYWRAEWVEIGGLMSYGPNFGEMYRRAATYVDRILRGDNPSHLPVEQPTKLELVMNLKTAKALGLTIPPSLLARADQVIE